MTRQGDLPRDLVAEALGTGALVAAVVSSGVMAQRLSPADVGLQLFENAVATGAALFVLITVFVTVSKAHFNPVVTLVDALNEGSQWRQPIARWDPLESTCRHASLSIL